MAKKLSKEELARMKTDFDAPRVVHVTVEKVPQAETKTVRVKIQDAGKEEKKHTGKGNPNGRPPSPRPRTATLTIRLTDEEKENLETAARLTGETKTGVIVQGIDSVLKAAKKKNPLEIVQGNLRHAMPTIESED